MGWMARCSGASRTVAGRALAVAVAAALVTTTAGPAGAAVPGATTPPTAAPAAAYAPIPGATTVEGGLYATVVSDGERFHSVMRTNAGTQTIQYRRSSDGGRTWVVGGSWTGQSGGATRPAIAVSGNMLAITYIGGYCLAALVCGEAAYLVRSANGGRSFTAPLRLSGADAFDAVVGVDASRIWVAWAGRNDTNDPTVFIRRYAATGSAPERANAWPGTGPLGMAVAEGGGVVTFLREGIGDEEAGQRIPRAQLLDGDAIAEPIDLTPADPTRPFQWLPVGVAAANGRAHLLFQDGAQALVRSASFDAGGLGAPVNALAGTGASIAARPGLIAVAAVDRSTGATSAALSSDGSFFGRGVELAQTSDSALAAHIGLSPQPPDDPSGLADSYAYVITETEGSGELTFAASRVGDGQLVPMGQRRLDRPGSAGSAGPFVGSFGPPAAAAGSAVASWYQLDDPAGSRWRSLLAQAWATPNASVLSAEITQAARGATTLVAGRKAAVVAEIRLEGPASVLPVTTLVFDDQGREVLRATDDVALNPGFNLIGFPRSGAFLPELGRRYTARVTVSDPPQAPAAASSDNMAEAPLARSPVVLETRPMRILTVPLVTSRGTPDCSAVSDVAEGAVWPLRTRMPVTSAEITPVCATVGTFDTTKRGSASAVSWLDYFARILAVDSVVGVAPDDWLGFSDELNTLAIANMPGRGIVFNADTHGRVVTHEATHNRGLDHWAKATDGWDVEFSVPRRGLLDYMNKDDGDQWVAAETWDAVARVLGGPANGPRMPDPASPGFWVRGEVTPLQNGDFAVGEGRWVPAAQGETTDSRGAQADAAAPATASAGEATGELEDGRLVARQLDEAGKELSRQLLQAEPVGGVYAPGGDIDPAPLGYTYSGLVIPEQTAARVEILLDDEPAYSRPVNDRPSVTVTAPTAGATANRGEPLTVQWTAKDPDGDPLTADLLVSPDGGATWEPLGYDVGASPATVTVPPHLDGDQVRVRVVVSDGVRMAFGDSPDFTVAGVKTEVRDRVVFSRDNGYEAGRYNVSLHAMDLDGGNEAPVPLPSRSTWDTNARPTDRDCVPSGENPNPACVVAYTYPSWSDDGSRIYFSSNLVQAGMGGAAIGQRDYVPFHLWSVKSDGSDLRRLTEPLFTVPADGSGYWGSNWCPNVSGSRVAWVREANGGTLRDSIWSSDLQGGDQRQLFKSRDGLVDTRDQVNFPWPTFVGTGWLPADHPSRPYLAIGVGAGTWFFEDGVTRSACPRFSPDGSQIAFVAGAFQQDGLNGSFAVIVMDADGGNPRIVTNAGEQIDGVDWLDNSRLLLTKRTPSSVSWDQELYTAVTLDLATQQRTEGASWRITDGPVSLRALGSAAFGPATDFSPTNSARNYDLATVANEAQPTSTPVTVVKAGDDTMFDGIRTTVTMGTPVVTFPPVSVPTLTAGGPYTTTVDTAITLAAGGAALADSLATLAWDLDGDGQFDDAEGPAPEVSRSEAGSIQVRVRLTPASGPAITSPATTLDVLPRPPAQFEVASDATGTPTGRPALVPLRVTIPAGVATPVRLGPDGDPGPFSVVASDAVLQVGSGIAAPLLAPATTGADGTVLVTPDAAFRGTARLSYARLDEPDVREQVLVEVTGPTTPPTTPPANPPTTPPANRRWPSSPR